MTKLGKRIKRAEEDTEGLFVVENSRFKKRSYVSLSFLFFLACFALFLMSPLVQLFLEPLPRRPVYGVSVPDRAPRFSTAGFLGQKYQRRLEDWFLKRHGLWGWLVGVNNELMLTFFGQVSADYGSTVLVGHRGQLFQPMHLRSFNKFETPGLKKLKKRANKLARLQKLLADKGVNMVVLVSTNVLALYPELIPSAFVARDRDQRKNSYEIMPTLLTERGVHMVDAHQLLLSYKDKVPYRFFQNTGSHWNEPGACLVTKTLFGHLGKLLNQPLLMWQCEPLHWQELPNGADRDLLEIANLLWPHRQLEPAPYVVEPTTEILEAEVYRPKMLMVGTSFSFAVLDQLKKYKAVSDAKLFFYYRTARYLSGRMVGLNRGKIDWENDIFTNDVIVIEENVSGMGRAGFSFVSDAIKQLRQSKVVK